jgi:hypothetical protein
MATWRPDRSPHSLRVGKPSAIQVDRVAEALRHGGVQAGEFLGHRVAVLGRYVAAQLFEHRAQSPHDLNRG